MPPNIQWNPATFNPVNVNPNAGLAIAAKTFGNIADTVAKQKEAESLATFRDREQTFVEQAPQRAIAEEERKLALSNKRGKTVEGILGSAGGSHMQQTLADLQSNPEYMAMSGPDRADFAHQALKKNRRLFSDPTAYKKEVQKKLLDSGEFGLADAERISTEKAGQLFTTLDKDIATKLIRTPGKGGSATATGTTRTGKQLFGQATPAGKQSQLEDFYAANEVGDKTASMFRIDPGNYNPTQQNVRKFVSQMGSGPDGVTQDNALQYLQTLMGNSGNVTSGHDISNLSSDDLKAFKVEAQNMRAAKERTTGGNALLSRSAEEASVNANNQAILDRLNPNQSSRELRLKQILSGLPGATPGQGGATPNLLQDTIDVDNIAPANTRAPTTASPAPKASPAKRTQLFSPDTKGNRQQEIATQQILTDVTDAINSGGEPTLQQATFLLNFPGAADNLTPLQLRAVQRAAQQ